jgi:hypothetical protein
MKNGPFSGLLLGGAPYRDVQNLMTLLRCGLVGRRCHLVNLYGARFKVLTGGSLSPTDIYQGSINGAD